MIDKYRQLYEALKRISGQSDSVLLTGKVVSVEGNTCTVKIADLDIDNVRLRATRADQPNKMLVTPVVNTNVLIGSLSGDLKELAVLVADSPAKVEFVGGNLSLVIDVEKGNIVINDGELGGLVNIKTLNDNLQTITNYITAMHSALPGAFNAIGVSTAANGPAGALTYTNAMTGRSMQMKDMEDKNVKH